MEKLLLVDDHAIVLDGLEAVLRSEPDFSITKVNEALFALSHLKSQEFSLIITDYSMPDMDGLTLVKKARQIVPSIKIIMLSMHDEPHIIREVMNSGVNGYVLKKYAQQELMHAIRSVLGGHNYWSKEVSTALLKTEDIQNGTQNLTEREIEVLRLIVQEMTSKEIAEKLFLSERTVETHRKNMMRKTNVNSTVGLIKYAYSNKLL